MPRKRRVSIILCCYNEEQSLPVLIDAIHTYMCPTGYDYEIIGVNDGSSDRTQEVLEEIASRDAHVFYIELSRNFGHQNALKAGLDHATGDCIISMDADMQHPPSMLPQFLEKWEEGYDIVYTRRMEDKRLSKRKRSTSKLFYKFLNFVSDINLENGTADFRLMNRKTADILIGMKGNELFIRGIVCWMGFKQYAIDYVPEKRFAGESKYTVRKMLSLAVLGILSFSTKPLHLALYLGFIISVLSLLFIPYAIISLVSGHVIAGWVSMILTVSFLGGLQLFILGIIGLYIGRIFTQVKGFPSYIVRNTNLEEKK